MPSNFMQNPGVRPEESIYVHKAEAARMLGVSKSLVTSLVKRGDLPVAGVVLRGCQYRPQFLREAVVKLGDERRANPPRRGRPSKNSRETRRV